MDSIQSTHPIFIQTNQVSSLSLNSLKPRSRSPIQQKQALLNKIKIYQLKNNELEAKNQTLLNTASDLKKLLRACASENDDYIKQIQEENMELIDKSMRVSAGLKYAHQYGKHIENCSLFWSEFLQ